MSKEVEGAIDYAKTKRHYLMNDYVSMPFDATQDYYTIGAMAYLANRNIYDESKGWAMFSHAQPAAPNFFGATVWPSPSPGFEGKHWLLRSNQRCFIRFGGVGNVQHEILANVTMEFWQRTFIVFVQGGTAGILRMSVEG